ncbi:MAG TPA: GMC family oxidoreductase [Propionibacteriaceae bacterium]|nr:GMC family oxidoreductase [Propionibacteriaceae bacterium]
MSVSRIDSDRLAVAMDAVIPADDFPSATQAGGLRFWQRITESERPEWAERVTGVLDLLDARSHGSFATLDPVARAAVLDDLATDPDYAWFSHVVNAGFYADPANGGNDGAASWRMLGWDPAPPAGWPAEPVWTPDRAPITPLEDISGRYDAVVVGSGAGGGVAAWALARAGRSVLLVERGDYPDTGDLARDHLRNARTDSGLAARTLRASAENSRTLVAGDELLVVPPWDPRFGANADTFGGGTRVYGAQAWRFVPEDFAMATTYGVPDGSALADWPVGYEAMEPFYTQAEYEVGVSGSAADHAGAGRRSRPYPMPPMPLTAPARRLLDAAQGLGWSTVDVPLAINSMPYNGRGACVRCRQCVGFACPVEAKNGSANTLIARAAATGNLTVLVGVRATRITTDARGRVTGVELATEDERTSRHRTVLAEDVVVSAGAVESARLLLASPSDREPNGLGNAHDQVGRHLQGHLYAGALGIFDEVVDDLVGPGPAISTHEFRHHNPGVTGGGMLANEFVPTPLSTYGYLRAAGLIPPHGLAAKQGMRRLLPRMQRVVGPVQEMTSSDSRVRLDRTRVDGLGVPVARLSGGAHPNDLAVQRLLGERAADWLRAAGASTVIPYGASSPATVSAGQHQAGTCRMGTDPGASVTDPEGRVWGHPNLRVADGSLNVTNGGVNPVLTIFANAFRIMHGWVGSGTGYV